MDKRVKLEESINYVGHMIKTLKDKRARLEKDVEEEAVDIKNLSRFKIPDHAIRAGSIRRNTEQIYVES